MTPLLSLARVRIWLVVTLAAVLVAATVPIEPAWAQDEPPDDVLPEVECPQFDGEPAAEDELTAYQYAVACGFNVEVTGLRDIDREVYATPEGTLDAQIAVEPYQVRDDSGGWVPINVEFADQADGSFASAATVIDIAVGAGGDEPFVTATDPDGGQLSLSWPGGGLPAPTVDGAVATYSEVLPGVDLAVQAEAVGFSWVLVVTTAAAADDPALASISVDIAVSGLTVIENAETGLIEVIDADGEVIFEAGQAIMWDSSVAGDDGAAGQEAPGPFAEETTEEPPADPGAIADVAVEITDSGIDLIPDAQMLADEAVAFPVYIDPPFTSSRKSWANVYAGRPNSGWTGDSSWPRAGGMRVGYNTWPTCGDGCGLWRSVITLNIGKLNGKYIASAAVKVLQTHTGGCGSYGLQLWRTEKTSNSVSWNGVRWLYGGQLETQSPPSSNTTGNCGSGNSHEWVSYDGGNVKRRVQSAADQRYDTISFGLQSTSEGDRNAWRRVKTSSVRLEVKYYIYPPKPDVRTINGTSCKTSLSSALWITSATPTLSVRARSYESESVYVRLRVREVGADGNFWYYRTPDPVGSYSTVNRRVTRSLPDGAYTWQTRADSRQTNAVNSGYTDYCYFKVDSTKPTVPTVVAPNGPYTVGQNIDLDLSASDPIVNGVHSGMNRFEYSWNSPRFDKKVKSTGSAGIALADAPAGRHVLYVRSVDNAGNTSNTEAYTLFVGSDIPATSMAGWRLGTDLADDSENENDLTLSAGDGAVFAPDPSDAEETALQLDGSTCLTADAPVRTDAAFSVSLRVRMDAKPAAHAKVLTQGDSNHSAYQVQYSTAEDKWFFSMLSADYNWYSVGATNPVALGEWLHIIGTYDPDAEVSRIYFNRELVGERSVDFEPWDGQDTFGVGCLRSASGGHGHYFTGAVDNVGVWSGLLSKPQISLGAKLPAGEIGRWEMRGDGIDSTRFGRDLTVPDSAQTAFDPFGRPHGALVLDGQSCADGDGPMIPADDDFGISAWVKPTTLENGYQVFLAHSDADGDGFALAINPDGEWVFGSPAVLAQATTAETSVADSESTDSVVEPMSTGSYIPPSGQWQNVALQHSGSTWDLLVNGDYYDESDNGGGEFPGAAGVSDGPLTIGCIDVGNGFQNHFTGMVHDVRLWRGHKDSREVSALFANPPAELEGSWRLKGRDDDRGDDTSGKDNDLALYGETSFNDGYACDPDSALELDGAGSAATAGPVIATDQSFTVSAWVRMDTLGSDVTFASAAGQQNTGFRLQYRSAIESFQFVMTSGDEPSSADGFKWHIAHGGPTPATDMWYHLVGVYDLYSKQIHLYVSGELVASASGPTNPWYADGPLVVGASGRGDTRWQYLDGAIDDVLVWQSVVPDHIIGQISAAPIEKC